MAITDRSESFVGKTPSIRPSMASAGLRSAKYPLGAPPTPPVRDDHTDRLSLLSDSPSAVYQAVQKDDAMSLGHPAEATKTDQTPSIDEPHSSHDNVSKLHLLYAAENASADVVPKAISSSLMIAQASPSNIHGRAKRAVERLS